MPGLQGRCPWLSFEVEAGERVLKGEDARPGCPASRYPCASEHRFSQSGLGPASDCGVTHMPREAPARRSDGLPGEGGRGALVVDVRLSFHLWEN